MHCDSAPWHWLCTASLSRLDSSTSHQVGTPSAGVPSTGRFRRHLPTKLFLFFHLDLFVRILGYYGVFKRFPPHMTPFLENDFGSFTQGLLLFLTTRRCHVAPNDLKNLRHPAMDIPREAERLLSLRNSAEKTQALTRVNSRASRGDGLSLGKLVCKFVAWRQDISGRVHEKKWWAEGEFDRCRRRRFVVED